MTTTVLGYFEANGEHYQHVINYKTDATHIRKRGETLFTITNDAVVLDKDGKRIGRFQTTSDDTWRYVDMRSQPESTMSGYGADLLRFERHIFKKILEENHEVNTQVMQLPALQDGEAQQSRSCLHES